MANSIQQNQYWLRLVVCASENINPGFLNILHNDGPNPDPTYIGIPRDPKLLYTFLTKPKSLHIIKHLKNKNVIKQDQLELLFPPGCVETDSKKFDPTLNQVMIRNFTTLKTANGWWEIDKILPGDITVAANTVRAAAFINFVYHYENPAAMKKIEFDNKFTEVDNILKGMRYTANIIDVKTMSLDPERISVLKALYNLVQIQINKLQSAYDKKSADDIASFKVLTTEVSKFQISSYEKLSKEKSASAQKMADQLLDHVHKLMLDIDSIKDEMTNKIEELVVEICAVKDDVVNVKKETSKQICTIVTKVNKMEGELEDRLKNVEKQHILTASK